ncbi:PAS domain S-box protein [Natronolimnobius sp. AArcel1]|uniref:PAS domain S-box protein n=1 Tax=Natronolimnobius sp. AArcel1 TaxID=1679093 RepID=UPI0013EBABEE|nr:PAS domain S-box protein [Natronolimnobius sp. AArcel1]NGM67457.1 PAS domain S-box protein [Natronolimnobius sp. AArcel1]
MSRPRVLCVSDDRATRASLTLALTDEPVNVVFAQQADDAGNRLECESIDAIVIDASTVTDVPRVIAAAEAKTPKLPTFVYWETPKESADESMAVLSQVVARSTDKQRSNRLADTITDQLNAGIGNEAVAGRIIANARVDTDGIAATSSDATGAGSVQRASLAGTPADADVDGDANADSDTAECELPPDLAWIEESVRRRLADATSPAVVEHVLREEFVASDRFVFAWVGEYDRGEREIVPWLTDPDATEWPMQRTFSVGTDDDSSSLLEQALHDRTLRILDLSTGNSALVPFAEHARERNVGTVAAMPLASDDELYGVFVIYARRGLSPADRRVIRSSAAVASHVLETIAASGQLEQQARALHRYERLVETAGDGMYVFDEDGNFMTVNDALVEMTGYSREGLLGEPATVLLSDADVEAGEDTIKSLLRSDRGTDTVEVILETKDGETIPCEIQIAVLTHGGTFHGTVGVVRDITDRKRRERKLRERNERLDAFAQIVSHDLRNPLGVAQGYLELMDQTDTPDHISNVRDGLDRMESIIDDVLAIARGGEWAADTEPVDLEAVATDAWDHVETPTATLSVTTSTTVAADRSRLLRLLENCFRNSVEHGVPDDRSRTTAKATADADGETGVETAESITIQIGTLENAQGFYVADDGCGLPEEIRDEIFDPSVSTSSTGLGIGLWVVREVATGHGWSVTAGESEAGGARFEFETTDAKRRLR